MTTGLCGGCGGPLDDNALELSVTVSPGPRGGSYTATVSHYIDRWHLCAACQETPAAGLLMKLVTNPWMMAVPPRPRTCEVHCLSPVVGRRRLLIARDRLDRAQCPHCFGPAELIAMPDAPILRRTLLMRLTGQTYRRPSADDTRKPRAIPAPEGGPADD